MRPFDHAWRLLKSYTSEPARTLDNTDRHVRAHRVAGKKNLGLPLSLTMEDLTDLQPRSTPPAENHAALANLSDEELKQMAAESERIHREEMDREYMREMDLKDQYGKLDLPDIFDEGGNAAAGEGYMSGGRPY
jgi:hypothetical protein